MKTLLRIDASPRKAGSHSRALADNFQTRWQNANPDGKTIVRDLADAPVPHLSNATIAAFTSGNGGKGPTADSSVALSDVLVAELAAADEVLVSSPLYNFGPPSALKAYLDHIVRFGRTFGMNERGYVGLLRGKSACIVTARGGAASSDAVGMDFQGPLLQTVFQFMGFERVEWIALEGTSLGDGQLEQYLTRARTQMDAWFTPPTNQPVEDGVEWRGAFSAQDRAEINALRASQVRAILASDAAAYAGLCAEDVMLMLQGHEPVTGREGFLECETRLLQTTRFTAMRQIPLHVERQGRLAVEIGRQEVLTAAGAAQAESFKAHRKYTHVLRKTAEGWRFAVLMSNNSV